MIEGHAARSGNSRGRAVELSYQRHETLVTVCPEPGQGAGPIVPSDPE
jgi:hypothetical protein